MSADHQSPYTVEQFTYALREAYATFNDKEKNLLYLLYVAPDHTARSSDLAHLMGETHHGPVNTYISKLAKKVMTPLGVTEKRLGESGYFWFMHIAGANPVGGGWSWTLFPELVRAIELTGVLREREVAPRVGYGITLEEYASALVHVTPNEREKTLLVDFVQVQDGESTAGELAEILGWKRPYVNRVFGGLAHRVATYLGVEPMLPVSPYRNRPEYWSVLTNGFNDPQRGFVWTLYSPFERAVREQTWFVENTGFSADVIPSERTYFEGAARQFSISVYERDPRARIEAIRHYGAKCVVCGFSFEQTYGPSGAGIIHVHHIRPLHEIGAEYAVDPIADLRPVCPNCHAMIHSRRPQYSIDEVSEMWRRNGESHLRS